MRSDSGEAAATSAASGGAPERTSSGTEASEGARPATPSEARRQPGTAPQVGIAGRSALADDAADSGVEPPRERDPQGAAMSGDDAGVMPPVPSDACGSELDVANGSIVPNLGVLPNSEPFSGTPSDPGAYRFSTAAASVPIQARSVQAAGQTISVTAGSLNATAYIPSGAGPFPLVLVLAGFQASYSSYATFSEHFASHGFAVLGVDTRSDATLASHDKEAVEVVQTIDFALSAGGPFAGTVDPTKIVVAGHSKGGKVAFYAAALDPRIDFVIGWDPVNAGGGPCAFDPNCNNLPVAPNCAAKSAGIEHFMRAQSLVIGAPPDPLFNPEPTHNAENFYRGAPSPAWFVRLDAAHTDWVEQLGDAEVIRITKAVQVSLLLARLRHVTGLEGFEPGGRELAAESLVRDARRK